MSRPETPEMSPFPIGVSRDIIIAWIMLRQLCFIIILAKCSRDF